MKAFSSMKPGHVEWSDAPEAGGKGNLVRFETAYVQAGDVDAINRRRGARAVSLAGAAPLFLGSSAVGRCLEVDTAAQARGISTGTRVVVAAATGCGSCDWCKRGAENHCEQRNRAGAGNEDTSLWSEMLVASSEQVIPVADAVDDALAALVPAIASAVRIVRHSRFQAGDSVAVFGLDIIGLLAIQVARQYGAGPIHAIDADSGTHLPAQEMGAQQAWSVEDYGRWICGHPGEAPRHILLVTPASAAFEMAVRVVSHRGVIVAAFALDSDSVSIPDYYLNMIMKETAIVGVRGTTAADWTEAVRLVELGAIRLPLPRRDVPFGPDGCKALESLAAAGAMRVAHFLKSPSL